MTRIILIFLLSLGLSSSALLAQMQVSFSDASGQMGTQVSVDVTTDNFPDLVLFQFSVNWDPSVMTINSITNINTDLTDYNQGKFGLPQNSSGVMPGQLTTTWNHPQLNPVTLPAGTRLFTMVFDLVGAAGSSSSVMISDEPKDREAVLDDFATDIGITANVGTVTIEGMTGNGDELTVNISDEFVGPNGNECVRFTVENFSDIESVQWTMNWDPAIATYSGFDNFGLTVGASGAGSYFNDSQAAMGRIIFFWSEPDAEMVSLNDGDVLFDLCFDAIGSVGQSTNVSITGNPTAIEVFGNNVTYSPSDGNMIINNGSLTIQEMVADPIVFSLNNVSGQAGETVCMPVSVQDFTDVVSFRHTISWNPSEVTFASHGNYVLLGLSASDFQEIDNDKLRVVWNSSTSDNMSASDGNIYEVCFNILEPCTDGTSRQVRIGKEESPEVGRIVGGTPVEVTGVQYNDANINCREEVTCSVNAIDADCGDGLGDLFVTIENADPNCTCSWSGTGMNSSTVADGCNFLNVSPGTYTFTLTCDGSTVCSETVTVDPAPTITVSGNVTNASCGMLGAITAVPSGGQSPYNYSWSNGENTPTITGLTADTYTVTVSDAANCSNTRSFEVTNDVADLTISMFNSNDVSCNGGTDGSASVVASGGCGTYNYEWTGSNSTTNEATNLGTGSVSVTVTDDQGDTATMSFNISEPDALVITPGTVVPSCPDSLAGSLSISVTGGTAAGDYQYAWTPNVGTSEALSGLNPGDYTVVVTDDNDCTATTVVNVPARSESECGNTGLDCPEIAGLAAEEYNGFNVSCNGEADGIIRMNVTGGPFPVTIQLSGAASATQTVNAAGSVEFADLGAGSYTVMGSTAGSASCTLGSVNLTAPAPLSIVNATGGEDTDGQCDGFIDYSLTGAVGNVTCTINGVVETDCDFSDLCAGTYVIAFMDENGCTAEQMVVVPSNNPPPPASCFQFTTVITPNMDGKNDFFDISCVRDFASNLQVYDRWGRLVYEMEGYDGTWDGTDVDGNPLPESSYMYVLNVSFGNRIDVMKGTLTLLR